MNLAKRVASSSQHKLRHDCVCVLQQLLIRVHRHTHFDDPSPNTKKVFRDNFHRAYVRTAWRKREKTKPSLALTVGVMSNDVRPGCRGVAVHLGQTLLVEERQTKTGGRAGTRFRILRQSSVELFDSNRGPCPRRQSAGKWIPPRGLGRIHFKSFVYHPMAVFKPFTFGQASVEDKE
ncbi:hypothetical protein C0J52_07721 [Blattella germanica]|nr:hypothetical protein C0J52_07721 [Blattella germanica]